MGLEINLGVIFVARVQTILSKRAVKENGKLLNLSSRIVLDIFCNKKKSETELYFVAGLRTIEIFLAKLDVQKAAINRNVSEIIEHLLPNIVKLIITQKCFYIRYFLVYPHIFHPPWMLLV